MAGKGTQSHSLGESVPAVVRLVDGGHGELQIDVDCRYLEGLVGFETGHIQRPGLSVHLYEEAGTVHKQYNKEIAAMLQSGLWTGGDTHGDECGRQCPGGTMRHRSGLRSEGIGSHARWTSGSPG